MNVGTQRVLDRIIGIVLCRLLSLFPWKYRYFPTGIKPDRILIILLSEMGSLVLAKPMVDYIKSKYPLSKIHLLIFERNRELVEMLRLVSTANVLTVSDHSLGRFVKDSLRVLIRARRIGIDTAIDCELFSRITSIYSLLCGAKIRVGFHPHTQEGLFRGSFMNRPVLYSPYTHISEQFITMVEAIESRGKPGVKRQVFPDTLKSSAVSIDHEDIEASMLRFKADFPHVLGRKLVLIYPGGGLLPIRAWPVEYFCLVADDLIRNGYAVGLIGMKEDKRLAQAISSVCSSEYCVDLTGYTKSVGELIVLLHSASLLISNDGGPAHFAATTSIPSIVLYGPETPTLYGTLSPNAHFFYVPMSCSPCLTAYNHRKSPCDGDNRCLKVIMPEAVLKKAYWALEGQYAGTLSPQNHAQPWDGAY